MANLMRTDLSETGGLDIGAQIRNRLIGDLKDEKFLLYFQSIVPVAAAVGDKALHREILIRFKEEERDLMPPGMFLPMLEQHGLMPLLDRWVTGRVLQWLRKLHAAGTPRYAPRCSINLSSDTIRRDAAFGKFVHESLARAGVPPASLSFEIPMTEVTSAAQSVARLASDLRAAGCGTVFSGFAGETAALELACSLGVSFVKIDGSLVYPVSRDSAAAKRLHAVQQSCRSSGVQTICTQVEDAPTLEILRRIQVNYAQGFGIDRPRPLA
jgi:EAL domain-containing protein (putative c-di-GMP-specific phosphodiesterase class I)